MFKDGDKLVRELWLADLERAAREAYKLRRLFEVVIFNGMVRK